MFASRYLPCSDCGASVERAAAAEHLCSPDRLVEYAMFGLREEIAGFETRLRDFLQSSRGRFEVWLAAREIRER